MRVALRSMPIALNASPTLRAVGYSRSGRLSYTENSPIDPFLMGITELWDDRKNRSHTLDENQLDPPPTLGNNIDISDSRSQR